MAATTKRKIHTKVLVIDFFAGGTRGVVQSTEVYGCNNRATHLRVLRRLKDMSVDTPEMKKYEEWIEETYGLINEPGQRRPTPQTDDIVKLALVKQGEHYYIRADVTAYVKEYGIPDDGFMRAVYRQRGLVIKPPPGESPDEG